MTRPKIDLDTLKKAFNTLRNRPLLLTWFGLIIFLVAGSLVPEVGMGEKTDKLSRVIFFTVLSFLPAAFTPRVRLGLILASFMAPLGFLIEVLQRNVPGRNFSPEDMIANNIGAIAGILAALVFRMFILHRLRRRSTANPVKEVLPS